MTVYLVDVGVLIALMDPNHGSHEEVHEWAGTHLARWSTCPITENGFVRILSQPRYPGHVTPSQALDLLSAARSTPGHEFWPCDISLTDGRLDPRHLVGHRQVTDSYLLALAVAHEGTLVTLDRHIEPALVYGAEPRHLVKL
ncbi:MAG: VapC toxin family PIN domain ribonuclease [bacterium]|nr:VapC toxin family PIN domain ribonuclease [bacterium]